MSYLALNSSATGMTALNTQLDVIANNIANADTTSFKSSRADFQDLYYLEKKQPGVENQIADTRTPNGLYVGLGVEVAGTQLDMSQGSPIPNTSSTALMIQGNGFFQVNTGDEFAYTRDGAFQKNSEGDLVSVSTGYRLEPAINIPAEAESITVGPQGTLQYLLPGQTDPVEEQIEIAIFQNSSGLRQLGENLYGESIASGPPIAGNPGEDGAGTILANHLEGSNVDPVTQLVDLIRTQRAFEMNSQAFNAADETLQTVVNLGR